MATELKLSEFDKYFTHTSKGGYSTCIHDSDLKTELWDGATVPNCVGLAWGWFNMARKTGKNFKRLYGNAGTLYATAKKTGSGFMVSKTPKDNSILVYGAGTSAGHVVYLLHKYSATDALMVESNYSGIFDKNLNTADKAMRFFRGNPKTVYKDYKGCIYSFV